MFKKIKKRLEEIKKNYKKGQQKEEIQKIYRTIKKIKKELKELEKETESLLSDREIEKNTEFKNRPRTFATSKVDLETILDKSWNYIVSGKYHEAINILSKAKKFHPKNIRLLNLLGWALIHIENFKEAKIILKNVLELDRKNEIAKVNLNYLIYKQNKKQEAIKNLSEITENGHKKQAILYAFYYLGLIYIEKKRYSKAIDYFNQAIALGPNLYEAYYYLGLAYSKRGLRNVAVEIWERLLDLNEYNIWAKKTKERLNVG